MLTTQRPSGRMQGAGRGAISRLVTPPPPTPDRGPPSRPTSAFSNRDSTSRLGVAPRVASTSRPATPQSPASTGKAFEAELEKRTVGALKEYYGLQDVKEVEAVLESSASYHSKMISLWIVNSVEGNDPARESLAKLTLALAQKLITREQRKGGFKLFLEI